tara:strand:+ start:907 stop:1074 length:168 start_codon:yes stop_codon:yes gene_type:complete
MQTINELKKEYFNLCLTFGTIEVDSIISFEQYKDYRNLSIRQSTLAKQIEEIINL